MSALHEGFRISNYLLQEKIGAGSFGEVWRAKHHVFDDLVAVKIPTDAQFVRNLRREGVVIHGLRHPNIVRAIDLDPYGDPPYLIMEYVEGPSLREAIDRWGVRFPIPAAVSILRGVLSALAMAHENGVIHRDIKPGNILLKHPVDQLESITGQAVKVTDFGLGRVGGMTAEAMMQSGSLRPEEGRSISGTIAYMSPEQREGEQIDARSDLYACGIVLFEMLTGERPHGHETPGAVRPEVPGYLDGVFRRSYCRLERRYASTEQMSDALTDSTTATPPPVPPPAPPGGHRKCPKCRGDVQNDDQFCIRCGQQLVESIPQCHKCGGFVHASDRFCIFCGADLRVRTV